VVLAKARIRSTGPGSLRPATGDELDTNPFRIAHQVAQSPRIAPQRILDQAGVTCIATGNMVR
jgi:hypothetical protein